MISDWVSLAVFDTLPAATIAHGRLQAEGIACRMLDHSLLPLGIVADGLELQVQADQFELAQQVLAQDYSDQLD